MLCAGEVEKTPQKIPLSFDGHSLVFRDDGDGIFHNENKEDWIELPDGTRISDIHSEAIAIQKALGISTFQSSKIIPLSFFCMSFERTMPDVAKTGKVSKMMDLYIGLRDLSLDAGLRMEPGPDESRDGFLFDRAKRILGPRECYLYLGYAQRFNGEGLTEAARHYLMRSTACAEHHGIPEKKFDPVVERLLVESFKKELDIMLAHAESFLGMADMNWESLVSILTTNMEKIEAKAGEFNQAGYVKERLEKIKLSICRVEISAMMARLEAAANNASFEIFSGRMDEMMALPETGHPLLRDAYRKVLESKESVAQIRKIGDLLRSAAEVVIQETIAEAEGYAKAALLDSAVAKVNAARMLARVVKLETKYAKRLDEVAAQAYVAEAMKTLRFLEKNFTRLEKSYMERKVAEVEALARKGGIEKDPEYAKQLGIVKKLIEKL